MLGSTLFILVIFGAGWGLLQTQADWLEMLGVKVSAIADLMRDGQSADALSESSSIAMQVATIAEPPAEVRSIEAAPSPRSLCMRAFPPPSGWNFIRFVSGHAFQPVDKRRLPTASAAPQNKNGAGITRAISVYVGPDQCVFSQVSTALRT